MKPKTALFIFILLLIAIVLFAKKRSVRKPRVITPQGAYQQPSNTSQNKTGIAGGVPSLSADINTFDNLLNATNPDDFNSGELSGI